MKRKQKFKKGDMVTFEKKHYFFERYVTAFNGTKEVFVHHGLSGKFLSVGIICAHCGSYACVSDGDLKRGEEMTSSHTLKGGVSKEK